MAKKPRPAAPKETGPRPKIEVAKDVLNEAISAVDSRGSQHGDTENSFTMIAEFWTTYTNHAAVTRGFNEIYAHDVAQMMSLLKVARSVYRTGNDNFVDGAGYTALAAMLNQKGAKND